MPLLTARSRHPVAVVRQVVSRVPAVSVQCARSQVPRPKHCLGSWSAAQERRARPALLFCSRVGPPSSPPSARPDPAASSQPSVHAGDAPDIYPPPLETNDISARRSAALSLPRALDFGIDFIGCAAERSALQAHNTGVWTTLALDLLAAVRPNGVSERVSDCGLTDDSVPGRCTPLGSLPGNAPPRRAPSPTTDTSAHSSLTSLPHHH